MNARLLILALAVLATTQANAAELYLKRNGNIATFYLDLAKPSLFAPLNLDGQIDTIDFMFTAGPPGTLTALSSGAGKPAGEPFTYRNRMLDADPLDGGLGWSVVGQTINASGMTWAGGPLGATISTSGQPDGRLFLANLHFNAPANKLSGTGRVQLIRAGNIVAELLPTPEPAASVLGVFALVALRAASRGRRPAA